MVYGEWFKSWSVSPFYINCKLCSLEKQSNSCVLAIYLLWQIYSAISARPLFYIITKVYKYYSIVTFWTYVILMFNYLPRNVLLWLIEVILIIKLGKIIYHEFSRALKWIIQHQASNDSPCEPAEWLLIALKEPLE